MSYRCFKKIFSLILVVLMLIGGIPALAANDIKMVTNDNDIVNAIEQVIESIYFEKEYYGFGESNLSELSIGTEIPNYEVINSNLVEINDISYYPILDKSGEIVSVAAIAYDGDYPKAYLSCDLVPALKESQTGQGIALVYDRQGAYCWNGEKATLIESNNMPGGVAYRSDIANVSDATLQNTVTRCVVGSASLNIEIPDVEPQGYGDNAAYVSVPVKRQPSGSSWCWAASMASVVQHETGISHTCTQMANLYGASNSTTASISTIQSRLRNDFGLLYNYQGTRKLTNILNSLGSGHASIGAFFYSGGGHAAVIRGIDFDSKVFSIMDPQGTGSNYTTGQIVNSSGNYGDLTYIHSATGIRLTVSGYIYM